MAHTGDTTPANGIWARLPNIAALRIIYLRTLSLLFMTLGLYQWALLLGAIPTSRPDFFTLSLQQQAVILFFAVANLVASVGLWMNATWGIVVWVSAASTRIARHTVFASTLGWMPVATTVEVALIVGYLTLIILQARADKAEASRQRDRRRRAND